VPTNALVPGLVSPPATHFVRHFPAADYWLIEQIRVRAPPGASAIGRLYLDRSAREWRLIDIMLMGAVQGPGLGSSLTGWALKEAAAARAKGVPLHVAVTPPAPGRSTRARLRGCRDRRCAPPLMRWKAKA
jgi:hypothetical protein